MNNILLFLRAHGLVAALTFILLVLMAQILVGTRVMELPDTAIAVQYRSVLPLLGAVTCVAVLESKMRSAEIYAARGMLAWRAGLACLLFSVYSSFALSVAIFSGQPILAGMVYVRSGLIWLTLGLLSALLFTERFAWVLPIASLVPVLYIDRFRRGTPATWNWCALPWGRPGPWLVLGAIFVTLGITYCLKGWRFYFLRSNRVGSCSG